MTIGKGALQKNYVHRKIMEILLGRAGVDSCSGVSNQCKFGLANQ